ncbi:hypothetical protein HMPREF1254_1534 [Prevotella sp. BV3P1]|nr:hypothetical protein HMPREF1254_1534 [Prevotella sp. BV3P1]
MQRVWLNGCGMMNLHTNLLDNKRLYPWRICKLTWSWLQIRKI